MDVGAIVRGLWRLWYCGDAFPRQKLRKSRVVYYTSDCLHIFCEFTEMLLCLRKRHTFPESPVNSPALRQRKQALPLGNRELRLQAGGCVGVAGGIQERRYCSDIVAKAKLFCAERRITWSSGGRDMKGMLPSAHCTRLSERRVRCCCTGLFNLVSPTPHACASPRDTTTKMRNGSTPSSLC